MIVTAIWIIWAAYTPNARQEKRPTFYRFNITTSQKWHFVKQFKCGCKNVPKILEPHQNFSLHTEAQHILATQYKMY